MPSLERYLFACDGVEATTQDTPCERSFKYKYSEGSFPKVDVADFLAHSGVGFGSGVDIWGAQGEDVLGNVLVVFATDFTKLMSSKNYKLAELMQTEPMDQPQPCRIICEMKQIQGGRIVHASNKTL